MKVKATEKASVVADATFRKNNQLYCVEIDRTQMMGNNAKKVKAYRELAKHGPFTLIWITTTEYRRKKLQALCEGLDTQVYTIADIKE